MMPLKQTEAFSYTHFKIKIIFALIVVQFFLFYYLLALDVFTILFFTFLVGVPIAFLTCLLFSKPEKGYTKMSIVMFSAGGFGMLLGCVIDLGPVGVYGLLSICQATSISISEWNADVLWSKFQLTPWTYIGMFTCGNFGMVFLNELRSHRSLEWIKLFFIYVICNIGMLLGMLLGESISAVFIPHLHQFLAAGLMIISMLLGMVFGMILLVALVNKFINYKLFSVYFNYGVYRYDSVN